MANVTLEFRKKALDNMKNDIESKCPQTWKLLEKYFKYSSASCEINISDIPDDELEIFYELLKNYKMRIGANKIRTYIDIKNGNKSAKIHGLDNLVNALKEEFKNLPHKWIFIMDQKTDRILPYFIENIRFYSSGRNGDEPYTQMNLLYNGKSGCMESKTLNFFNSDLGNSIEEILQKYNIIKEDDDLMVQYNIELERYLKEKKQYNKQYIGDGFIESRKRWDSVRLSGKFINDEEINENKPTFKRSSKFWTGNTEEMFELPHHMFLYLYSLSTYENCYMHINDIKDYIYDESLRDKLVLPETHKDLLDILTCDIEILNGDIIDGKSTGTTILCYGEPGVGKTLTAEVYSEIIKRPLFKVSAGQLGVSSDSVEKTLTSMLKMSERWGAVMLLDEADTYIRKRDNDMEQNAIVAAFLRTLEYFNGLMFMTTNRGKDVDDAIVSRCIAQIEYKIPDEDDSKKIWKVLAKEFQLDISDDLFDELVKTFPSISGRDIKELLILTGRYCKVKGLDIELKHFISCSQFRGISAKKR